MIKYILNRIWIKILLLGEKEEMSDQELNQLLRADMDKDLWYLLEDKPWSEKYGL